MASVNNNNSASSVAYSYLQYKNKIGGLVSGMDIDSIMEKLMKAESAQMEKLQQQKQKYEWKRDAYREVNTKLNTFQQDLFDKFGLQSKWSSKTATVTNNTGAVSVEAKSNAAGNLSIQNVSVATAATSANLGFSKATGLSAMKVTTETSLTDAGIEDSIKIFGETATTFGDVVDQLNANGYTATLSNGQLKVTAGTNAENLTSETTESLKKLGFSFNKSTDKLTYNEDGVEKTANSATKLSDLGISNSIDEGDAQSILKIKVGDEEKTINLNELVHNNNDAKVSDLLAKIKTETGLNVSFSDGAIKLASNDGDEITVSSTDSKFQTKDVLANSMSSVFLAETSDSSSENTTTITGKNTIEEVLGKGTPDGSFVLRAVQADGTTKDKEITYKATDTIDSLMSKINSSGVGVTALFSNGQLSFSASNTGQRTDGGAEVSLVGPYQSEDSDGVLIDSTYAVELFSKLSGGAEEYSEVREEYALATGGKDASMTVNGVEYTQASNVFTISGYTITANEDFSSSKSINIASTNNTSDAVDKVKEFVEMYNSLIEGFNKQTSEKRNVGYDPLTDAQKAEMTTSEIEKWEEKAKAGLLKGDTSLSNMLSKMRSVLNGGTGGDTLYNIGITTSSTWSDNGKLVIDETKLTAAIEKDPDILSRIFVGTTENPGMASQLRTEAKTAISNIEKAAGKESSAANQYSLGKTITTLTSKIDDWKDRLKSIEERYWNQFSAMETAIQKANNQSSIFMQ